MISRSYVIYGHKTHINENGIRQPNPPMVNMLKIVNHIGATKGSQEKHLKFPINVDPRGPYKHHLVVRNDLIITPIISLQGITSFLSTKPLTITHSTFPVPEVAFVPHIFVVGSYMS